MVNKVIMGHPALKETGLGKGINTLGAEEVVRLQPLLKSFLGYAIGSVLLMVVIIYVVYTITRCGIWCTVDKKKFSLGYFKRSLLLNLAWAPFIVVIGSIASLIVSTILISVRTTFLYYVMVVISLFLLLIVINLHFLVYHNFTKLNKIFLSIGNSFSVLFKNLRKLLLPFVFMVVVFFIIMLPFGIIQLKNPYAKYQVVQGLVFIVYLAWLRFYLVQLVKKEALRN